MKILGQEIDFLTLGEVLERVEVASVAGKQLRIVTVNTEFLVRAQNDPEFAENLKKADLRIADGSGVQWAAAFLERKSKFFGKIMKFVFFGALLVFRPSFYARRWPRTTGADLTREILGRKLPVNLIVRKDGLTSPEKLQKLFPNAEVFVEVVPRDEKKINLVALGAPKQEYFAERLAGVSIGVGGSLDFLAGTQKRAPRVFRAMGCEWLWRLFSRGRFGRVWDATFGFCGLVLRNS